MMEPRSRGADALAALLLAVAASVLAHMGAPQRSEAGTPATERPNVVLIMADDMRVSDMQVMGFTAGLFGTQGVEFEHGLTTFPLCCPSRASFMTGQYTHNHGVDTNSVRDGGGYPAYDDRDSLPVALDESGYTTGFVGKFLNGYGNRRLAPDSQVPRGWDLFAGKAGGYHDFDLIVNGERRRLGPKRPNARCARFRRRGQRDRFLRCKRRRLGPYLTDKITAHGTRFVRRASRSGSPFFLWLSHFAPHVENSGKPGARWNPRPAIRHRGAFRDASLPRSPAFNEADLSDKPSLSAGAPLLGAEAIEEMTWQHRSRLASLLAVDQSVKRIVRALTRAGQLENTYIFFVSDNGFVLGGHRGWGKRVLYEESLAVPYYALGPGLPRGHVSRDIAMNIDFAPTVYDVTGVEPLREPDGMSLRERLGTSEGSDPRQALIVNNLDAIGLRTSRYKYIERTTRRGTTQYEFYDLARDPHELDSQHGNPSYLWIELYLARRLDALRGCAGDGCSAGFRLPQGPGLLAAGGRQSPG